MSRNTRGRIPFVLPPEKVVRIIDGIRGECLACEATGVLVHRLGTLWEGRRQLNLLGKELVHRHWCPMNRVLFITQNEDYNKNYQRDYQTALRARRKAQDESK